MTLDKTRIWTKLLAIVTLETLALILHAQQLAGSQASTALLLVCKVTFLLFAITSFLNHLISSNQSLSFFSQKNLITYSIMYSITWGA